MDYDGNVGVKIFTLFSIAYVVGAAIVGAIRYRRGSKLGLASVGFGLLVVAAVAVALAGPFEQRSGMSWLIGVGEVFLILGACWLAIGSLGLWGGALVRKTRDKTPSR